MNPNLDFLRAIAVLCVFFAHLYEILEKKHAHWSHHFGQLGVILFFVHTSLVLMMSLERSKSTGFALFRDFFISRFFRLYPLSIVCVIISFMIPNSGWSLRELVTNLTLTQNLTFDRSMVGALWTLPLEVQMYLMLPFLFVWLREKPIYWALLLWVLSVPVALIQPSLAARLNVLAFVPCFIGGVIAWRIKGRQILPAWLWPLGMLAASIPWMASDGNQALPGYATCIALGLIIPLFSEISSKWLIGSSNTIAKYSYGIYLTHVAAMTIAFKQLASYPMYYQVIAFVVMAVSFPVLAYHLIEHPMIKFGKRLLASASFSPASAKPATLRATSTDVSAEVSSSCDAT